MSKELLEKKNDLITRAEEVLATAKEETRELTEAEAEELAEIRDNVRKIVKTLEITEDFEELKAKEDNTPIEEKVEEEIETMDEKRMREDAEVRAFDAYLRNKMEEIRDSDDPVNMDMTSNGAIIPTSIANKIIKKVYDICPILERSSQYNVKGKLEIPYYGEDSDGFVNVAYASEFVELSSNVGKFTTIELTDHLAGALVLVSRSLVNNAGFNLVDFVVDHMAYAIKRFVEGELLNGTEDAVEGLSTLTNIVTSDSGSAITADEVIELHDAIKDEYQNDAIWIMSPQTRTALRELKGNTGYYLLNDDISTPFGTTLLGKPVYVSDNMPDMGEGNTVIYYGDMKGLATKFAEGITVDVLRERYADQHAIGVIGWVEFDAKVEDAQKVARLVMGGDSE